MILWNLTLAVHLLAMLAWVGGTGYALLVLRPSLAVLDPAARLVLQRQTLRRFLLIVWHAMPLSLLTGWAMVFGVYGGFANLAWTINVMHLLGLVMAGVFLALVLGPWRRLRAGGGSAAAAKAGATIERLMSLTLGLGVLTLIVAVLRHFGA